MDNDREFTPIKGSFPDAKKIQCRDCVYRDRTEIKVGSKTIKCGITKDFCEKFPKPPISNGKPPDVLFRNARCTEYIKGVE